MEFMGTLLWIVYLVAHTANAKRMTEPCDMLNVSKCDPDDSGTGFWTPFLTPKNSSSIGPTSLKSALEWPKYLTNGTSANIKLKTKSRRISFHTKHNLSLSLSNDDAIRSIRTNAQNVRRLVVLWAKYAASYTAAWCLHLVADALNATAQFIAPHRTNLFVDNEN